MTNDKIQITIELLITNIKCQKQFCYLLLVICYSIVDLLFNICDFLTVSDSIGSWQLIDMETNSDIDLH